MFDEARGDIIFNAVEFVLTIIVITSLIIYI